jgi:hypothetical protein
MKKIAGISLLVLGAIILLAHPVKLIFLLLIGMLLVVGVKKLKHKNTKSKKILGYTLLGSAVLLLLCQLPFLIRFLIGGAFLYLGWKIFDQHKHKPGFGSSGSSTNPSVYNYFDEEWQAFRSKHKSDI